MIGLTLLGSMTAFAEGIIGQAQTTDVTSITQGSLASECKYQADKMAENKVKVRLNSDIDAFINFGFELPAEALPLKEGYSYTNETSNETITYNKGVLKFTSSEKDKFITYNEETIELEVSADLQVITTAKATDDTVKKVVGAEISRNITRALECKF